MKPAKEIIRSNRTGLVGLHVLKLYHPKASEVLIRKGKDSMHVTRADVQRRTVDDAMTILGYFQPTASSKVSLVGAELNGEHSLRVNKDCDQIYYVLDGEGVVSVDNDKSNLRKGDAVLILAGQRHLIRGNLELLIVNGPAYDPDQTEVL